MPETVKHEIRTVDDLLAVIERLKAAGKITGATPVSAPDIDGGIKSVLSDVMVFNPNAGGIGTHKLAIWGRLPY